MLTEPEALRIVRRAFQTLRQTEEQSMSTQTLRRPPSRAKRLEQVNHFNAAAPIGTPVRFWRGTREGEGLRGITRSDAWLLSGETPVVMVEGCSGAIALTHVEVIEKSPPRPHV